MSKIIKFTVADKEKHALAMQIRTKVFVEEQNVDIDLEIENEEESIHFLLYYRRRPVATARYRMTDKGVKLERFAMLMHKIPDLRSLFEGDIRLLEQFR